MRARFAPTLLRMSAGAMAWVMHFSVVYGATTLACSRGMAGLVPWLIAGATVLAGGACVALLLREWGRRDEFEAWLAAMIAGLALFAIFMQAAPVLGVTPCA